MKPLSLRVFSNLAIAVAGGAVATLTTFACGSSAPAGDFGSDDSSAGSSGAGGGSGGSSSGSGGDDGGAGSSSGSVDATLPTYDGPPPNTMGSSTACSTPDGVPIRFNPMYSGYDGVHSYQVPAFVAGVDPGSVTWSASDMTKVDLAPYVLGIMITTKAAGTVQIIATVTSDAGTTSCGSAPLTITQYTADEWNAGNMRYNNGNQLNTTNLLNELDAGAFDGNVPDGESFDSGASGDAGPCFNLPSTFTNPFEMPPAACTDCHGAAGNSQIFGVTLFSDVSHTPEQTGGYSEDQLKAVYLTGTVPAGGYFDPSIICYASWHMAHQWTDISTTEGQTGMNAYLRSLTPKQQLGCFDIFSACDGG